MVQLLWSWFPNRWLRRPKRLIFLSRCEIWYSLAPSISAAARYAALSDNNLADLNHGRVRNHRLLSRDGRFRGFDPRRKRFEQPDLGERNLLRPNAPFLSKHQGKIQLTLESLDHCSNFAKIGMKFLWNPNWSILSLRFFYPGIGIFSSDGKSIHPYRESILLSTIIQILCYCKTYFSRSTITGRPFSALTASLRMAENFHAPAVKFWIAPARPSSVSELLVSIINCKYDRIML